MLFFPENIFIEMEATYDINLLWAWKWKDKNKFQVLHRYTL